MLTQYLQCAVWQTFLDLPFLPKVGFSGILECTRKSRSREFLLAP